MDERTHLRNTSVLWESEREELIVMMEAEFVDAVQAENALSEELLELASGALGDCEGARVDVLQIEALAN